MNHFRAARRAVGGLALLGAMAVLIPVQMAVGSLTGNYRTIPKFLYNNMRRVFGIKVEFNENSAPLEKKRPTWFVANHMSMADFFVLGSVLDGAFAGKGELLKNPVIAMAARSVNFIPLRRSKEFNAQSHAKIINNFNEGFDTIAFLEATTSNGAQVHRFRTGLLPPLFGAKGVDKQGREVALECAPVMQPVAIRVKEVNGQDATGRDDLRNLYSLYDEHSTLKRLWTRMAQKRVVIELTAFPPLDPKDFADREALASMASAQIRSVVAPHQTEITNAPLPWQKPK